MTPHNEENTAQKSSKKHWLLLLLLLLAVLAAGICIGGFLGNKPAPAPTGGVTFDPNAGAYQEAEADEQTTQGVSIPGKSTMTIPANQTEVAVDFYNPEQNDGLYYLTYELRLLDSSEKGYEVLYSSGLIPPNQHIQKIALSHGLHAGTYEAILHVQPYRMDEGRTPTNNADMKTKLIVQ